MAQPMPVLPVDLMVKDLDDRSARIVRECFNSRSYRNGCAQLRASKPYKRVAGRDDEAMIAACVNYVWRLLCFDFCDWAPHVSMPVTADFDIGTVVRNRND